MFLKFKTKKNIICYLLLFLTVWPFVHFALANTLHINHWKFFGLAMYITPTPFVAVEFSDLEGKTFLDSEKIFSKIGKKEHFDFITNRTQWGRLYKPDKLANSILTSFSGLKGIKIFSHVAKFNYANAKPYIVTDIYMCIRGVKCRLSATKIDKYPT